MQEENIETKKEINNNIIIDVKSQKEIIDHAFKQSFKYTIYAFIFIIPTILVLVFALIYFIRFFASSQ
jgi:hypothetical protein